MRVLKSLPFLLAGLLSGCSTRDASTSADTESLTAARATLSAQDRLDVPDLRLVKLAGGRTTLAWSPIASAKGYQLVSCDTAALPTVEKTSPTDTVHLYTGLTPGAAYGVKIRARKVVGAAGGDANNSKFSECKRWIGAEPVASILLAPTSADLMVGASVQFTATLLDRYGAVLSGRDVTWESATPAVATVNATGLATAVGAGTAVITVASEGVQASATVTVREPVASVSVSPASVQLYRGQSQQFTATARDRFGNALSGRTIIWTTSSPAVATVSNVGLAAAVGLGTATVTATSEGKSGSATITVQSAGWQLLAPGSAMPSNLTSSTYAAARDAIFAGEMPDYGTGAIWRFDLAAGTWSRVTANNWPNGKYRKLIYDAARDRLLTYWDGLGQVFSLPAAGGSWSPEGTAGNSQEFYEAYAFSNPVNGRLSVFAGYGFGTFKNILWEWNGTSQWLPVLTSGQTPAPRFGGQANVVVDAGRSRAFLTQRSLGGAAGNYDDLSVLDLRTYAFRQLIAPNTGPDARLSSGLTFDPVSGTLFRFGGASLYGSVPKADFVHCQPDAASVAWSPMPSSATTPGPRYHSGLHFDALRRRIILVSGHTGTTWTNDVWAYPVP